MSGSIGDNPYRASGVVAAAAAGGGVSWQGVTTASTLTVEAGKGYPINTTSNACTVTLPSSASVGDEIILTDYLRTWGTNNLTISSSLNYQGSSSIDPVYDTDGESVHIVYMDVTQGWVPTYDGAVAYETEPALYVTATGPDDAAGVVAADDADYKVHEFTTTKSGSNGFSVSSAGNAGGSNTVEYMIVAGGGGGGYGRAGGAGAGGMRTATGLSVSVQDYDVTVGTGGAGSGSAAGGDGNASSLIGSDASGITTVGGGGGGNPGNVPGDGGSGGGTTNDQGAPTIGTGTAGEGNNGGTGAGPSAHGAGGGGGKGAVGGNGSTSAGGNGGTGLDSSIRQSGVSTGYGGGGGGGTYISGPGGTTTDGGGEGGSGDDTGDDGVANTGGGGGGGGHSPSTPRNGGGGGKGMVIIRYKFQN